MTKIKNTKTGMAKKTLSMSLVVAMRATSNVPVWAAEFSDGSETPVATEAPAAEAFSDDVAETPVVEDNTADVATESSTGKEYTATFTPMMYNGKAADNTIVWGSGNLSTSVTVTDNDVFTGTKPSLKAVWRVGGKAVGSIANLTSGTPKSCSIKIDSSLVGKKVELFVYAVDSEDTIKWSATSNEITVNAKKTAEVVSATAADVTYTGEIQKAVPTITAKTADTGLSVTGTGTGHAVTLADLETKYTVGYDENSDYVNVTDKPITITLTPKSSAYTGSITATYKILPKNLSAFDNDMVATLKNPVLKYNGKSSATIKVKK